MRPHGIRATALVTLSIHALVAVLSVAAMCTGGEHTHGGVPAPDCGMHEQHDPAAVAHSGHHGDHAAPAEHGTVPRIGCRCDRHSPAPALGLEAMVLPVAKIVPTQETTAVIRSAARRIDDTRVPPLSPPPRPHFS